MTNEQLQFEKQELLKLQEKLEQVEELDVQPHILFIWMLETVYIRLMSINFIQIKCMTINWIQYKHQYSVNLSKIPSEIIDG